MWWQCHRNRWCIKVLNLLPRLHSQFLLLTKSTVTVNAKYVHPEKYTSTPNWVYVETSLRCCNISKFFEHIPDQVKRRIRLVIMTLVCVCVYCMNTSRFPPANQTRWWRHAEQLRRIHPHFTIGRICGNVFLKPLQLRTERGPTWWQAARATQ